MMKTTIITTLVCFICLVAGAQSQVVKQTQAQAEAFALVTANAQQLSEAATPELLAYLDSAGFRANISNLPEEIQQLSAEELLVLLNDTLQLSTVTHGLFASSYGTNVTTLLDITLQQLLQTNITFLPSLWERIALGLINATSQYEGQITVIENEAEVALFLLPKFNTSFSDLTLDEAQNRISYAAFNLFRDSDGSQYYGNMQLVLNSTYINSMLLLSPYDTGDYATCCLLRIASPYCRFNESMCPNITFGTVSHWNHLFLQNQAYWKAPLLSILFQRLFAIPQPPVNEVQEIFYFEADIFGNILFPEGVEYVIGDFATLFGRAEGGQLQQWCIQQGVPLVWSFGIPNAWFGSFDNFTVFEPQNQSFIDPFVLQTSSINNVTATSDAQDTFAVSWKLIGSVLSVRPELQNSLEFWVLNWADVFKSIPSNLHFFQIGLGQCQDSNHCVGVDGNGDCVCRFL